MFLIFGATKLWGDHCAGTCVWFLPRLNDFCDLTVCISPIFLKENFIKSLSNDLSYTACKVSRNKDQCNNHCKTFDVEVGEKKGHEGGVSLLKTLSFFSRRWGRGGRGHKREVSLMGSKGFWSVYK